MNCLATLPASSCHSDHQYARVDYAPSMNLTPDEVLTTTRAVRKRLDYDRPVEPELIKECLTIALQAPSGSNRQAWQFVVIGDPSVREQVAARYRASFEVYAAMPSALGTDTTEQRREHVRSSAQYLADTMHRAPYLLIPVAEGRAERLTKTVQQAGFWGSATPALWSFMLAARARGLGTAWTTLHLAYEKEVADIIGIPYERYTQIALTPSRTPSAPTSSRPLASRWNH